MALLPVPWYGNRFPLVPAPTPEVPVGPLLEGHRTLTALLVLVLVLLNLALTALLFWNHRLQVERLSSALRSVDVMRDAIRQIRWGRAPGSEEEEEEVELLPPGAARPTGPA